MTDHPADPRAWSAEVLSLNQLKRLQEALVVRDVGHLEADIWDSDEELDDFLADWRTSHYSSLL